MVHRWFYLCFLALGVGCYLAVEARQPSSSPKAEEIYKDIKVFRGLPASELTPAMEFMSASLGYKCVDCHDPKDFAAPHKNKETARQMVVMQREINDKNFNGKLEVTCMTCHQKQEHPLGLPLPEGVAARHTPADSAPKPEELIAKYRAAAGTLSGSLVRVGTLTAPSEATHKVETVPLELVQAEGGRFRLVAGERKIFSNGRQTYYGTYLLTDEAAAIFGRIGRSWLEADTFNGLEKTSISGRDEIAKQSALVVRGNRPSTNSTEFLSFGEKSGLLVRMLNLRRSTLGTVASAIEYQDHKRVGKLTVPMKVDVKFGSGERWTMEFKSAKLDPKIEESLFSAGP